MDIVNTAVPSAREYVKLHAATPSFLGIMRGEFIKISRLWLTWIMLVMLLGAIMLPYLLLLTKVQDSLNKDSLSFFYNEVLVGLSVLRIFIGFFILILTAYLIGLEYQLGTIRILLARGVGRLQLLGAKVLVMVLVALILFIIGILLNVILTCAMLVIVAGSLKAFGSLTPAFWLNTWLYMLTVLVSIGATILLATGSSVLFRTLAFGLSAAVAWFAIDNIGLLILLLIGRYTQNDFWLNISAYVLGPNLNAMAAVLLPQFQDKTIGITPLVQVSGTHTLLVALAYSLAFAILAIILTWKRDVKE